MAQRPLLASTMSEQKSADMTELTRRLNDGQVFYLQGEYSRAAIVLMDLIKRPGIEGTLPIRTQCTIWRTRCS